jgi:hypothetical protein
MVAGSCLIVARQFFYGIWGTRQALMLVELGPGAQPGSAVWLTWLLLVTGQTQAIYANHPMPQEEWFRGKL